MEEKIKAIKLRERGYSYSRILKNVSASKSTISVWLRDIELTPEQERKFLKGREISRYRGARTQHRKRRSTWSESMAAHQSR